MRYYSIKYGVKIDLFDVAIKKGLKSNVLFARVTKGQNDFHNLSISP